MSKQYDFCGWATRNDVQCSDGRTIRQNAFKHQDGETVPLVDSHLHTSLDNVLGHALLENRPEGVYAYCTFNETEKGKHAKQLVEHGDITQLSIYANKLRQQGADVLHGAIKELSLVLAGANPCAKIETVIEHSEEFGYDEEAVIFSGENLILEHANKDDEEEEKPEKPDDAEQEDEESTDAEEPKPENDEDDEKKKLEHADTENAEDKFVEDIIKTMNEEQKQVLYAMTGMALAEKDSTGGKEDMKHNAFDTEQGQDTAVLSHSDIEAMFAEAKRSGSFKEAFENMTLAHGITNIEYLFPDARVLDNQPQFIQRDMDWVADVMGDVHKSPFSRIKSVFANITEDEARAKGYIKGNMKKEEFFSLLKRSTDPQTIYKKQKLDRDDIIDITDLNVVVWIRKEMRMMLEEEAARAILIGDGRLASDDDKIKEDHIRPVASDAALYTINVKVTPAQNATEDEIAKAFIRQAIKARKDYKGSGNPKLYTTEDMLTNMLLLEDGIGHALYADEAALARKLRVSKIVTVPVMEGQKGKNGGDLAGVIVNLKDYNVGADKGGEINNFDDFDIDYNQYKYLIETRMSGALTKPYSAMAIEIMPPAAG